MILADVMEQLADQLDTIEGLRTFGYPPANVEPPAAIVTYPSTYDLDATYVRGADRIALPIVVMVGKVSDRSTRDRVSAYVSGAGASSIKAVAEAGTYAAFDTVRITSVDFEVGRMAGVEYLMATFEADIFGTGGNVT